MSDKEVTTLHVEWPWGLVDSCSPPGEGEWLDLLRQSWTELALAHTPSSSQVHPELCPGKQISSTL